MMKSALTLTLGLLLLLGCNDRLVAPDIATPEEALLPADAPASKNDGRLAVRVPRQTVEALRDGLPTTAQVSAHLRIDPDGEARGELRWSTREDGRVVVRAVSGRGVFDEGGALVRVEVVFREANGEEVAATVVPAGVEDCLLWDLINGSTGEVDTNNFPSRARFEASGELVVQ